MYIYLSILVIYKGHTQVFIKSMCDKHEISRLLYIYTVVDLLLYKFNNHQALNKSATTEGKSVR